MPVKPTLPQFSGADSTYHGNLIESLVETVDGVSFGAEVKSGPRIIKTTASRRNYFRVTELPTEAEIHCATVDCDNLARLLLDSRDAEVLPYCAACAHVEFAMWMVGL